MYFIAQWLSCYCCILPALGACKSSSLSTWQLYHVLRACNEDEFPSASHLCMIEYGDVLHVQKAIYVYLDDPKISGPKLKKDMPHAVVKGDILHAMAHFSRHLSNGHELAG